MSDVWRTIDSIQAPLSTIPNMPVESQLRHLYIYEGGTPEKLELQGELNELDEFGALDTPEKRQRCVDWLRLSGQEMEESDKKLREVMMLEPKERRKYLAEWRWLD